MAFLIVSPTPAPHRRTATPLTQLPRRWGIQFGFEHRSYNFLDLLSEIAINPREFLLVLHDVEYCVLEHISPYS
jgi:hypothetical protein